MIQVIAGVGAVITSLVVVTAFVWLIWEAATYFNGGNEDE